MTVGELIEVLKTMPQDLPVGTLIPDRFGDDGVLYDMVLEHVERREVQVVEVYYDNGASMRFKCDGDSEDMPTIGKAVRI